MSAIVSAHLVTLEPTKAKAGHLPGLRSGPALCGASVFTSAASNVCSNGVSRLLKETPSPWAGGRIKNHESLRVVDLGPVLPTLASLPTTRGSHPARQVLLIHRLPAVSLS